MGELKKQEEVQISNVPAGFNIDKPEQAINLAKALQKYAKESGLIVDIKGKNYAMVEAWQFAGSQLGLYPIVQSVERQKDEKNDEIKYRADVDLFKMSDDKLIGRGSAICSNLEAKKRNFDEFAIMSMAQTRAVGKAYRLLIGWFMKAAGFEGTPAEEMEGVTHAQIAITEEMKKEIKGFNNLKDLYAYAEIVGEPLLSDLEFIKLCKAQKAILVKPPAKKTAAKKNTATNQTKNQ